MLTFPNLRVFYLQIYFTFKNNISLYTKNNPSNLIFFLIKQNLTVSINIMIPEFTYFLKFDSEK